MSAEDDDDGVEEVPRGLGDVAVDGDGAGPPVNFAELLGPDCMIKRVDKDQKVIGQANPDDMQRELMTRASTQKRLGACAEHVKHMSRADKLLWAVDLKDRANEFYSSSQFEEAARLYNDCLVALDLDGSSEEVKETRSKLQLPVCTNLAACMIEMGQYESCIEICDIALDVDPGCCKALYRRGLAHYRLGDHLGARPDFEAALRRVRHVREQLRGRQPSGACAASEAPVTGAAEKEAEGPTSGAGAETQSEEERSLADVERRVTVYLSHIRKYRSKEKEACKKMFEQEDDGLYADRPGAKPESDETDGGPLIVDDSDEAIEAALARVRGDWRCCPCRRSHPKVKSS